MCWRDEYEFEPLDKAYKNASALTDGFSKVDQQTVATALLTEPATLRVFRTMLGFTAQEFAAATRLVIERDNEKPLSTNRVRSIEKGIVPKSAAAEACAKVIGLAMTRQLFGDSPTSDVRLKTDKPDTRLGWESIVGTLF